MKVLQFSGGLDSLATLYTLRPEWGELVVLWCDTGDAYPTTVELMGKVASKVPHFETVRSDVRAWRRTYGLAVDTVPERHTLIGAELVADRPQQLYTSFISCCSANIWLPLEKRSRELGATVIYRGQKASDKLRAPIKSGHEAAGVKYIFPIEMWSRDEVRDYCLKVCPELVPGYYFNGEDSSHDCMTCIAYLAENVERIKNLPGPERQAVLNRLSHYQMILRQEITPLMELL